MEKSKPQLSKGKKRAIIVSAISFILGVALIITNFFVPVKYLASYMVAGNKGAPDGVMRVRFVDVGYGNCTIIELPDGKNMLIDAGNGISQNQSKILKYLNSCKISTIDYLICASVNAEHCGGLSEIIRYKAVKRIYMPYSINTYITDEYRDFSQTAKASGAELFISEYGAGVSDSESGYFFTFLSPSAYSNPKGEYADLNNNPSSAQAKNDASAVIWLEYAGTSFLFTGDVTSAVMNKIRDEYLLLGEDYGGLNGCSVALESLNVISVANHGSVYSACAAFYDLAGPETAVIQVGDNGYGCPSAQAISDAANYAGENLFRTDVHGTVTIEVTKDGYKAETEKK